MKDGENVHNEHSHFQVFLCDMGLKVFDTWKMFLEHNEDGQSLCLKGTHINFVVISSVNLFWQ